MVKIGDRVRILAGTTVGQDFRFFEWSGSSDVVFTVTAILNCDRCALEAPGYGVQGDYGNGRVFVNADRLVAEKPDRLATLEAENAKLRDLLRRVWNCTHPVTLLVDMRKEFLTLRPEIKSAIEPGNPGEVGES